MMVIRWIGVHHTRGERLVIQHNTRLLEVLVSARTKQAKFYKENFKVSLRRKFVCLLI